MKLCLLSLIILMTFGAQASNNGPRNPYSKVDEVHMVAEWLHGLEHGENVTQLEKQIDKVSNRIFTLRRAKVSNLGRMEDDYKAYVIARTEKLLSFISVEKNNKIQFYYGATAPQDLHTVIERVAYLHPRESISDPNFFKVYKSLSEISETLYDIYGDYPMSRTQMLHEKQFTTYGGYGIVRVELNPNMPENMLEEFLLLLWSSLEKENVIPTVSFVGKEKICSSYLSHN